MAKASRFIPNGVWGHNKFPSFLNHGAYPYFASEGKGARFFDVDGNEYIDYLCGYGAMINGYANERVDRAAMEQMKKGDCFAQPTDITVKLAELLVSTVDGMDWCSFGKNGSDALNIAMIIARAHNQRSKALCFNGAYHGSHLWCNWCNPGEGRPLDDSMKIMRTDWNDCEQLEKAFRETGQEISAVILTPFHQPIGADAAMPTEDFVACVTDCCEKYGALLILDDVRTGFRLSLEGSHKYVGFRPHLTCLSKAIANTYPLAVTMGVRELAGAASKVFIAGTFWNNAAPMAAAVENLCLLHEKGLEEFHATSKRFCDGLIDIGSKYGFALNITGPATIPTVGFRNDTDDLSLMNEFAAAMTASGSFVHPSHNWFLSLAHSEEDIATSLSHAEHAFQKISKAVSLKTTV